MRQIAKFAGSASVNGATWLNAALFPNVLVTEMYLRVLRNPWIL